MNHFTRRLYKQNTQQHKTDPRNNRRRPVYAKQDIMAAKKYYREEFRQFSSNKIVKAMRTLREFDWLWEYQQGDNYKHIAFRHRTKHFVIRNSVNRARGRVETYLKLKDVES